MTEAQRQYFEAMEAMFSTLGWKLLMDDIDGYKSAISDQWRSINPEGLRLAQGRYDGLDQISRYEKSVDSWREQASEQDTDV